MKLIRQVYIGTSEEKKPELLPDNDEGLIFLETDTGDVYASGNGTWEIDKESPFKKLIAKK